MPSHFCRAAAVVSTIAITVAGLAGPRQALAAGDQVALVAAAKAADTAQVQALLLKSPDVNAADHDGTTALHWAAHNGDVATVDALIRAKADVNLKNRYGVAPIWQAAINGHADVVEALLRGGVDADTTRADSEETVLMVASKAGYVSVIQRLLAYGADPNGVDAVRKQTALMWASAERHSAAVRVLVEAGANIEAASSTGITPMMFAIRSGDIETTVALLELGANMKVTAPDGTTSLGLAILNAHWELAARLVEQGADVNGEDPRGRPLHMLAMVRRAKNLGLSAWLPRRPSGNIDSVELATVLLAKGARVNERLAYKNPNYNPTHMALGMFQATSWNGATPFYISSKGCDLEFMNFLLANGADPKINTDQGMTPLLAAAGIGYAIGESPGSPDEALEAVKLLAGLGLDVNATFDPLKGGSGGWGGASALHGAVIRGARGLVEWLIAQDIPLDLKIGGKEKGTALEHARGSGLGVTFHVQPELAEIIEKAMVKKGLPISEHEYTGDGRLNNDEPETPSDRYRGDDRLNNDEPPTAE